MSKSDDFKVLSFIQQTQQGSVSTLDRSAVTTVADNMVLQSFDLGLGCGGVDNMPPYIGDYAPSATTFYTELDSTIYSQGKHTNSPDIPFMCMRYRIRKKGPGKFGSSPIRRETIIIKLLGAINQFLGALK